MVDAGDLKSLGEIRVGSSPTRGTNYHDGDTMNQYLLVFESWANSPYARVVEFKMPIYANSEKDARLVGDRMTGIACFMRVEELSQLSSVVEQRLDTA